MLDDVLKEWGGIEVSAMEVYTDIFRLGENQIQKEHESSGEFKANPIGFFAPTDEYGKPIKKKGRYRILFEDTFEETLKILQQADFSIMNGITYFGRKNVQEHASKMYAMIFDLDGVNDDTLANFLSGAYKAKAYPIPNYIIMSGHGVHLYYVFEYGISLYPNIKFQLKELKYALTEKMWNRYTTTNLEKVQYQGINQGFRVIGSKTKIEGVKVRAFQLNTHPYCLEQLNQFVPKEKRIDESKLWKESKMTIAQAKKKYPEWYEKRVVRGEKRGTWTCKEDLYYWWMRKIKEGASVGHRYFCIMCLAIYGVKSGVSKEQVEKDALELVPYLNDLNDKEPFTESDVKSALECFDERYIKFPIEDISKISGINIEKNKRRKNPLKRDDGTAFKAARMMQELQDPEGTWRNIDGRPSKEELIKGYLVTHKNESVSEIARALNVSRTTVYKYYDELRCRNGNDD